MTVGDALRDTQLGIDTSGFIYFVEANPTYIALCREVFRFISDGTISAILLPSP